MHWTDEQIIASVYGVGPENDHLDQCERCRSRQASLRDNRRGLEMQGSIDGDVSFEFLAVQRRAVCEKLETHTVWASVSTWRRWAPVALVLLLLGSGATVYEERHARQSERSQVSDAQLALEVSRMSQDLDAQAVAPLQGLFE